MNNKKHGLHRVVAFLLALLLCLSGLPANGMTVYAEGETTYWTDYASNSLSGSGTQDDPFLIHSAADLALLAKSYNTTEATTNDTYFKVADGVTTIDLSAHDWVPIDRFFGHLDGNGVSITGLKIGSDAARYNTKGNVGLFGRIDSGSVVENLSVDVSIYTDYTASDHNVGGVAGFSNGATIDSCTVTGQITATISENTNANRLVAGGIVGIAQNNTAIVNCINKATINANNVDGIVSAAGIAAYTKKTTILNSCNFGSITADITGTANKIAYAGGIVVHSAADTNNLYNCYNVGSISASSEAGNEYAGSIAGQLGGCTADYLYWLGTENEWIGRDAGSNTTGEHISTKSETELKAMAETLNNNVEAIKDSYSNLILKNWSAEAEQYPELIVETEGGSEEDNPGVYWTDEGIYSTVLNGAVGATGKLGSETNPYLITSGKDLALLAVNCATNDAAQSFTTGKYFKIVLPEEANNTIDLSAYKWIPIARFYGHLDGNGASITGLKIGSDEENGSYTIDANVGLFGRIDSGSVVENLSVDVSIYTDYTTSDHNVGGIAGFSNGATIDSCTVTGQITAAISENTASNRLVAAGIVGISQNNTVIVNCTNKAVIVANNVDGIVSAAGVAGYTKKTKILNSCNFGSVTADITGTANKKAYAGGIVVHSAADSNELYNCYNTGSISASSEGGSESTGSIAGQLGGCSTDYLYWLDTTNAWIGNDAGSNTTGEHISTKSETELKAMAETLNNNVEAIKDSYTNLSLKNWSAEAEQYPEPIVVNTEGDGGGSGNEGGAGNEGGSGEGGGSEEDNSVVYWTDEGKYSATLNGAVGATGELGSETNPYLITSAQDLALLAVNCSTNDAAQSFTTGKYFEIVLPEEANNTIDLSEYYWTPIARFYGYLDGNGALISGLKIGNNEENGAYTKAANVGLFGRIDSGSVVEKLSVEVSIYTNFATANHTVGGVAGMSNGATIDSCTVTGQITAANVGNTDSNRLVAAGIVGTAQNNSVITNCVNKATVNSLGNSGLTFAAGIAGYTNGVKIINDCNIGVISAAATGTNGKDAYAGGIVVLTNGTNELHNCYNTGAITATSETGTPYPGSIAGQVVNCTMSNLYWQKDTAAVIFGKGATSDIAAMEADELKATDFLNSLNINAAKLNESAAANNAYKWITDTVTGYAIPGTELATDKTLIVNVNSERMGRVKVEVQTPNSSTYTEVATSTLVENGSTVRLTAIPVNGIKIVSMTVNGTEVTLTEGSYTFTLTASTTVEVIFEVDGQFVADPIYVNSNVTASGNGTSPATAFKTLAEAQTKLRTVLDANPTAEVTIYLMGGTYVLDETWELNEEDTSFGRVTIKNYEDETPVITSGHAIPLGGFSQVTGKNYWAYQIPQNADGSYPAFRDLLVNGERATLAKTKEYTYQKSFKNSTANGKLIAQDASGKYMMENGLYVSEEALSGITNDNFSGLELAQLQEWKSQIFHVGSIAGKDTESGEIEITIKDSEWDNYYTNEVNIFVLTGRNYWLQNHINFLDEPGEFYYDQSNGMVYYYPYADENMSEAVIEYATLDNLIDITNAANITIDGITFTGTTANTITEKGILAQLGLTTSTSQFDAGTSISFAAIKGDVVEGVCIQNCTFKELGGSGMVFYYDVKDMLINGNSFKDIAMAGILVGVNQRTFGNGASENVTISNNYITNIGVDLNGSPAIRSARAKDLKIQYNTIIHVPYSGIMTGYGFSLHATDLSRNTNLVNADISYNYVEDYLYKINDGGGIYTCGANQFTDNAELINKIHHNYVRAGAHNSTYTGIYHDGSASNWHTYENVIDDLKSRKGPMFFQDDVKDQYTHNILSEKNYTTVSKITTTASASRNIVLKDNVMFADRNELFASAEAAAIVNGAGLQNAYKGIATPMDVELRIADNTMHYVVDSSKETNTVAKIELTNNSDETRTFTISLTDALPNYVSCQLENNGVITLDANETAIVKAEFIVTDKNKFEDKEDFVIGFQVEDSVGRKTLYPRVFTVGCSTGEARIAHGTPTMDGVLDDAYMKSTNITVGNIFNMVSFTAHETPQKYPLTDADSDVTGFARLLWDEDYLYCYIYVEEKDSQVTSVGKEFIDYRLNDNASLPEGLWKNDGVELFIKTNGKSSKFAVDAFGIQRYGDNITLDVHNALPYTTAFTYNGEIVEGLKITNPVMGQSASTTEKPVNGYVIEMALPITLCSDLAVEGKPQAGDKIWFQMQNNDLERSEEQQKNYTVSLHTTGKEYLLVKEEVENNVASIDGVSYPTLEEALNNAEAGKTVKLEADATLPSVYDKEVTYDLNGHTLSGDAFTGINATVVDSSNGAGLLKVPQNGLALDSNNDGYMPVWDSTNAGYRFAKVTIEDRNVDNTGDALVFSMRPSFGSDAIGQLVAKGYETGMVRVGVRITWIDPETGITKTQDLALDDSLLSTMYSDPSAPKGVKFTISGGETIKSFTATTIVWSNLEKCKSVEIVGTKHTYQAKAE